MPPVALLLTVTWSIFPMIPARAVRRWCGLRSKVQHWPTSFVGSGQGARVRYGLLLHFNQDRVIIACLSVNA